MRKFLHYAFVSKPWLWVVAAPGIVIGWWLAGKWF
jgi:hypothetical protein